ncbi:putative lactate permease [Candidatus Competibacter denitrificans Run_A_D11]|uniref:L-lactate permease n=1 Tax=Candidatus Competibacter denitrificans Run_A_D11 TaxID=1400863 RepID=W6M8E1_9GAMM|nr:lactate permease LctP family transporter [Candidatus Competibacter denitrificans]CDI04236.1 putative lactate permease [Candidatus Competibacter denitrificans Run_A_D11]
MPTWTQIYAPLGGSLWLSAFVAAIPIIFFFVALAVLRMKGHIAALITVALAILVAVVVYQMPVSMALAATGYGFLYGLWPISWIIVAAVFLYKLTVKTGQFEIIRSSVLSITGDQRLQMILVGFCFGAFLEGAAGFGAPVAITAALLVGLGFNPLYAAGLCLIANTAPVAFGALGIPITVAGKVTSTDPFLIGQMAGRQLPLLSLFVPFWLVFIMDGWRGVRETWPAIFVAAAAFALTQYYTSNHWAYELPDITSALVSLVVMTLFLRFVWQPQQDFSFQGAGNGLTAAQHRSQSQYTLGQIIKAWSPFIVLTVMVTIWTLPAFKGLFAKGAPLESWVMSFHIPGLDKLVLKDVPIVKALTPYEAVYKFDVLSATGTSILLAAVISAFILGVNIKTFFTTLWETLVELARPIFTIGLVLGFAFIANYSGVSSTLGLAFAATGALFPFFSPFLGWLGVFLTGSDTSSNALFANLQQITAQQIGVDPTLTIAANTTGGVTGKMISPQSIAVACAAAGLVGKESDLFRFTLKHSLFFAVIIGIITYLQAYHLQWMIPAATAVVR